MAVRRVCPTGLLADLELALERGGEGLSLAYQPVEHVRTGAVVGVEALLRWVHPSAGPIDPAELVRLAEQTPLIHALTDWVMAGSIDTAAELIAAGHRLRMAVNVSPRDMADAGFAARVEQALVDRGLDGHHLMIEITESGVLESIEVCVTTCEQLRALGAEIALDDFGTGNRSVAELRLLPVTMLKLDRSLVADLDTDRGRALLQGLVGLADVMGVATIVEGIESAEARAHVRQAGCEQIQGFGVAPPMSRADLHAWLAGRASIELPIPEIIDVRNADRH